MKHTLTLSIAAITCISALAPASADAQRARRAKGKIAAAIIGNAKELGVHKDKFLAYQRLTAGGGEYYSKDQARLRAFHFGIYTLISHATKEDRITEKQSRDAISELLAIGKAHDEKTEGATIAKLDALKTKVRAQMTDKADAEILTPKVNNMQFLLEEVLRYAQDKKAISVGQQKSIFRKTEKLEQKEDKLKADGSISDRERKKLLEDAHDIWKDLIKALR